MRTTSQRKSKPPRRAISPEWRDDMRKIAAGMVGLFGTALFGWLAATQTFVVEQAGKLVHPSAVGWELYVCVVGIAAGVWLGLATWHPWLPLPFIKRRVDHSSRYSVVLDGVKLSVGFPSPPSQHGVPNPIEVLARLRIVNRGPVPIEVHSTHVAMSIMGETSSVDGSTMPAVRLMPYQDRLIGIAEPAKGNWYGQRLQGEIAYRLRYWPLGRRETSYTRTHRVKWRTFGTVGGGGDSHEVQWYGADDERDEIDK